MKKDIISYHEKRLRYAVLARVETLVEPILAKKLTGSQKISRAQYDGEFDSHHPNKVSECDCRTIVRYLHQLKEVGLWPISQAQSRQTLGKLCAAIKNFAGSDVEDRYASCTTCQIDFSRKLENIGRSVRWDYEGLCLDCFKRGIKGKEAYACRRTHFRSLAN